MDELDGRNFISDFGGRCLKSALERVPPAYFEIPVAELEAIARPTEADQFIKTRYWELAFSAGISTRKKHRISDIYRGICSYTHFWANIMQNPAKFAWIMRQNLESRAYLSFLAKRLMRQIECALENAKEAQTPRAEARYANTLIRYLKVLLKFTLPPQI